MTTNTARLPKRHTYQEFHDFLPNLEKEVAEYKKAIITDIDAKPFSRSKKKGEQEEQEPYSWPIPRDLEVKQNVYNNFVEQAINPKSKNFYQEKDENGATIPNTGATFTVRSITRTRLTTAKNFYYQKEMFMPSIVLANPSSSLFHILRNGLNQYGVTSL